MHCKVFPSKYGGTVNVQLKGVNQRYACFAKICSISGLLGFRCQYVVLKVRPIVNSAAFIVKPNLLTYFSNLGSCRQSFIGLDLCFLHCVKKDM